MKELKIRGENADLKKKSLKKKCVNIVLVLD